MEQTQTSKAYLTKTPPNHISQYVIYRDGPHTASLPLYQQEQRTVNQQRLSLWQTHAIHVLHCQLCL